MFSYCFYIKKRLKANSFDFELFRKQFSFFLPTSVSFFGQNFEKKLKKGLTPFFKKILVFFDFSQKQQNSVEKKNKLFGFLFFVWFQNEKKPKNFFTWILFSLYSLFSFFHFQNSFSSFCPSQNFLEELLFAHLKNLPQKFYKVSCQKFLLLQNIFMKSKMVNSFFPFSSLFFIQKFQSASKFRKNNQKFEYQNKKNFHQLLKIQHLQKSFFTQKTFFFLKKILSFQWFQFFSQSQVYFQKFVFLKKFQKIFSKNLFCPSFLEFFDTCFFLKENVFLFLPFFQPKSVKHLEKIFFSTRKQEKRFRFLVKFFNFFFSFCCFQNQLTFCSDFFKNLCLWPRYFSFFSPCVKKKSISKFSILFGISTFFLLFSSSFEILKQFKQKNQETQFLLKKTMEKNFQSSEKNIGISIWQKYFFLSFSKKRHLHQLFSFQKLQTRQNIFLYLKNCKKIIEKSKGHSVFFLLQNLSKEFFNFEKKFFSVKTLFYLDRKVFQFLWKWAKQSHPKKSKKWIRKKYFFFIQRKRTQSWVFGQKIGKMFFYLPHHYELAPKKLPFSKKKTLFPWIFKKK
jgi:hypothetical protein